MLTLRRRNIPTPDAPDVEEVEGELPETGDDEKSRLPDLAHGWTNRERLTSGLATGGLLLALACGPLALGATVLRDPTPTAPATVQAQDPATSQRVSEFASTFITRYLTTPQGQEDAVTDLLARGVSDSVNLAETPNPIGAITPGQAQEISTGRWIVTVGVETPSTDGAVSIHRYWQVLVLTDKAGSIAAGALPSLVSAPTAGDLAEDRGDEITNQGIKTTVGSFMAAYLAGQGEVEPLTAPGASITAVQPTPYTAVTVPSIRSAARPPESPREGDVIQVQISVTATAADGGKQQLDYTLDLRYRDRWEVQSVNASQGETK